MKRTLYQATIHVLIDADDEATACDTLSELFRNPDSNILDWAYITKDGSCTSPEPVALDLVTYHEGDFAYDIEKGAK